MISVIVVDDEPGALSHICTIIETKCPDFEVIATAENGKEGLEKARMLKPDLLISDVKMPILDGIGLVGKIRAELPKITTIIISGYQEFEYAQGALQLGVSDYILKPVVPSCLKKTLDTLAVKITKQYDQERKGMIHKLCNGITCTNQELQRYFPFDRYYCAVIRRNGLPRRFLSGNNMEVYSDIYESLTVYGRDEMESFYVLAKELLLDKTFEEYIFEVNEKVRKEDEYTTLVYTKKSFSSSKLQENVKDLYRVLDRSIVVGFDQSLDIHMLKVNVDTELHYEEPHKIIERLRAYLNKQKYDKFKREIKQLYEQWRKEKKTQLWLEHISRQILYMVKDHQRDIQSPIEWEYMMEDAFFYATSIKELTDNLLDIIFPHIQQPEEFNKVDSPQFFASIKDYIREHLHENLTLQNICLKFSVSQTYLSKLFRKYENQSFTSYVTSMRMKQATKYMREKPDMYIKDIAQKVGYNDQFYFSRIFRSYMGLCPTDYMDEVQK